MDFAIGLCSYRCVTLDKLLCFSGSSFSYLCNEDTNKIVRNIR